MSRGNYAVQCRVSFQVLEAVLADIQSRNLHSRDSVWQMSEWLRAAIDEKLAKGKRSREHRRVKKYRCVTCKELVTLSEISYVIKPLFGPKEYTCTNCVRVELSGN
jgi:hypothetical protein